MSPYTYVYAHTFQNNRCYEHYSDIKVHTVPYSKSVSSFMDFIFRQSSLT